jgi:hypothetical protein
LRDPIGVSIGAVVALIIEIGDGGKLVGDLPCCGDAVEIALIVIVVRRLRTDVGRSRDNDFALVEVEADPAVEGERVVILLDAGVHATRNTSH